MYCQMHTHLCIRHGVQTSYITITRMKLPILDMIGTRNTKGLCFLSSLSFFQINKPYKSFKCVSLMAYSCERTWVVVYSGMSLAMMFGHAT
jgi:hypothetical protein